MNRVPGVNTAARYSATEIYGIGGVPEKPEGVAWEDSATRAPAGRSGQLHYRKWAEGKGLLSGEMPGVEKLED